MKKADRETELVRLWMQRSADKRSPHDVLVFYGWVQQNVPALLYGMHGDPYQALKSALRQHIHE